jgi:hypothetical protein
MPTVIDKIYTSPRTKATWLTKTASVLGGWMGRFFLDKFRPKIFLEGFREILHWEIENVTKAFFVTLLLIF